MKEVSIVILGEPKSGLSTIQRIVHDALLSRGIKTKVDISPDFGGHIDWYRHTDRTLRSGITSSVTVTTEHTAKSKITLDQTK